MKKGVINFTKPEITYLIKCIDKDIELSKRSLNHTLKWVADTKNTDPYYQKRIRATYKKIAVLEKLRSKILK